MIYKRENCNGELAYKLAARLRLCLCCNGGGGIGGIGCCGDGGGGGCCGGDGGGRSVITIKAP